MIYASGIEFKKGLLLWVHIFHHTAHCAAVALPEAVAAVSLLPNLFPSLYLPTHTIMITYFNTASVQPMLAVPWLRRLVTGLSPRQPGITPRPIQWDLWWTKWHWGRFFSEFFGFPRQYNSTIGSIFPKIKKNSSFIHSFTPSLILIWRWTKGP
jgi:hypothetical protein